MGEMRFQQVSFTVAALLDQIELGTIGLPTLQRPFVWRNIKVRDLFDSMYRGFPIGYLLLWQNGGVDVKREIGPRPKQSVPQLLIVDGQQRLTALYAVMRAREVAHSDFSWKRIMIAFSPITERFEVTDAAIQRDKTFIPDISRVWQSASGAFEVVNDYLEGLGTSREVTPELTKQAQRAVMNLANLADFPITALQLAATLSEEQVADVFARINSKGTPLNQADFILTLMSVFWDEGRSALEGFCRASRKPTKGQASPFNYFIDPAPDQLLRAGVGVGFRRARLRDVYTILRGKDLETRDFSPERRVEQFAVLEQAQTKVLNLQYWHDFFKAITRAGYRGGPMITSKNTLIYSYVMYLIGRTEYHVPEPELRRVIARWFFMSILTGRYTSSPESTMEYDLAQLRDVHDGEVFVQTLDRVCDNALTTDFWTITLPNDLATSSARSPSHFAYYASLVLLQAKVLFSDKTVAELLDPAVQSPRKSVERHHLFPRAHLGRLGITATRDVNQIANFALVEWGDNTAISKKAPEEYVPRMLTRYGQSHLKQMYYWHALPEGWETMDYREFLERRRELMANVVRDAARTLSPHHREYEVGDEELDLETIVVGGEQEGTEFKSTLRINLHTNQPDPRIEHACLKTIAAFMNSAGGTLVIGVADDGTPVGIQEDGFANEDKMHLHLVNLIRDRLSSAAMANFHSRFEDYKWKRVFVVECSTSSQPVYVKEGNTERFFVRTGPATVELSMSQAEQYRRERFR